MINPLRSEAEAYRFVLLTVGYFAAIVVSTLAFGRWAGLAVFTALTVAGIVVAVLAFGILRTVVDTWYAGAEATSARSLRSR